MVKDNKEYSEEKVDKRLHKNRVKHIISNVITLALFLIVLFLLVFGKDLFKSFYYKAFENIKDTEEISEVASDNVSDTVSDTSEEDDTGLGNLIELSFEVIFNKDSAEDTLEFSKETLIKNTANGYSTDTKDMFDVLRELRLSVDDVKLNKVKEYKTRLLVYYEVVDKGESSKYLLELYKENGKLKGYKNYNFIETVGSIE